MSDDLNGNSVLVLGTHDFAHEVDDLIDETPGFTVTGFIENWDIERCSKTINDKPVHWVDDLANVDPNCQLICSIGSAKRRDFISQVERFGLSFATVIHPDARVARTSCIGAGSLVSAGVVVGAKSHVGSHSILNRGALVGHHTSIGDYVTIAPGANIAGRCKIGDGAYIAMGAAVLPDCSIGRNTVVGAGAVVTRDLSDNVKVFGIPAKVVAEDIEPM